MTSMRTSLLRLFGLAALFVLAGCKIVLHSNLEEREANAIFALLSNAGIHSTKEVDTRSNLASILIDESQAALAIGLLEEHGLPSKSYATIDQVFTGDGLVASPIEERARLHYAISQELARSISELDGVLSARVHVVMPEEPTLVSISDDDSMRATASVLIRRRDDMPFSNLVSNIKRFVSSSIQYLEYEDVAVIDFVVPVPTNSLLGETNSDAVSTGPAVSLWLPVIVVLAGLVLAFSIKIFFPKNIWFSTSWERFRQRLGFAPSGADDTEIPERNISQFPAASDNS